MEFIEVKLDKFIEKNSSTCEGYASEILAEDIYQAAEYLLNQI